MSNMKDRYKFVSRKEDNWASICLTGGRYSGIIYQYGIVEVLGDKEEHIVNTISNGLTTVLVDNPWLVDYMKKYI